MAETKGKDTLLINKLEKAAAAAKRRLMTRKELDELLGLVETKKKPAKKNSSGT